ncbi:hypothetical protein PL10110_400033 [Planktothrix agardhii]|nr:hypothetical protein PL10110_400033 [Planktothrix agardhii]
MQNKNNIAGNTGTPEHRNSPPKPPVHGGLGGEGTGWRMCN